MMNALRNLSRTGTLVFALVTGMAYLVPAGFASAYRLSERAVQQNAIAIPDAKIALQTLLAGDDEDCPPMEIQGWDFH